MVNVVVELKSAPSTASYAASTSVEDNWAADWCGDTTNLYRGALPFAFEQAIEYFETNRSEIDAERQKLELDITQEFELADGEATLLIDETK